MAIRATPPADPQVLRDIQRAASATAVDFGYLVAQASQESAFQPDAKSATSSATGLYQFTEATWLREFRLHGAQYGYGALAQAISLDGDGRAKVADPEQRKQILDLRKDAALSASLAAELARENRAALERELGRAVNHTELYLAHFLGAGGAGKLIATAASDSGAKAADLLPAAAAANPAVFYNEDGSARSVGELYRRFAARIEGTARDYASAAPPGAAPHGPFATLAAGGASTSPFALGALGPGGAPRELTPLGQHALDALAVAVLRVLGEDSEHRRSAVAAPAEVKPSAFEPPPPRKGDIASA